MAAKKKPMKKESMKMMEKKESKGMKKAMKKMACKGM